MTQVEEEVRACLVRRGPMDLLELISYSARDRDLVIQAAASLVAHGAVKATWEGRSLVYKVNPR